ncbi:MAG: LEA type 2 family protein [Treponema sp.]|jgi:LEA14-like dessication related protein|nr:LEA type 2 family protein [Treponema sp.]
MRRFLLFLLTISLLASCKSHQLVRQEAEALEVKEPDFQILSIAILQADLVNTQFEAVLKIDNPNNFAVNLSSLSYRLYGNGRFWADGRGSDILHVPANSSCETEFHFSMNFINMNRNLLDDIIALRQVQYRFAGDVEVEPAFPRVSPFTMSFERTGLSIVKEKADKKQEAERVYTDTIRPSNQPNQPRQVNPHDEFGRW